jgi:hypothetical protein
MISFDGWREGFQRAFKEHLKTACKFSGLCTASSRNGTPMGGYHPGMIVIEKQETCSWVPDDAYLQSVAEQPQPTAQAQQMPKREKQQCSAGNASSPILIHPFDNMLSCNMPTTIAMQNKIMI